VQDHTGARSGLPAVYRVGLRTTSIQPREIPAFIEEDDCPLVAARQGDRLKADCMIKPIAFCAT